MGLINFFYFRLSDSFSARNSSCLTCCKNKLAVPECVFATAYPDCRLVVTKETMTVEGMIKIVYDLLKDKLNIAKLTFTSGVNAASQEYDVTGTKDRCPLCGIALNENGVCPKCGYKK